MSKEPLDANVFGVTARRHYCDSAPAMPKSTCRPPKRNQRLATELEDAPPESVCVVEEGVVSTTKQPASSSLVNEDALLKIKQHKRGLNAPTIDCAVTLFSTELMPNMGSAIETGLGLRKRTQRSWREISAMTLRQRRPRAYDNSSR